MKINYAKTEVIMIHGERDKLSNYAEFFNCQTGSHPIISSWGSS